MLTWASILVALGLEREDQRAGGVIAPDAAQAVGDFPAPLAVDEDDHVEDTGRNEALVFGVALSQQAAQRRFDRIGRRALLVPDGV